MCYYLIIKADIKQFCRYGGELLNSNLSINLDKTRELSLICKALSSGVRINILRLLCREELNVNEIAKKLELAQSSTVMHVKLLEEAGLIKSRLQSGMRGSMKVCRLNVGQIDIVLDTMDISKFKCEVISMPIGHFVDYKVQPTCGLVSEEAPIGEEDEPRCFFDPDRIKAQLIWLRSGYLEYRFPNSCLTNVKEKVLEVSAELCSEDHEYKLDCPSDITLWINGREAGTWTCPSDYGGRRGLRNPDWWPDKNTQYGILKTWRITEDGSYIDEKKVNDMTISDYKLYQNPYISVRIGVKDDAKNIGGINVFGEHFGDYSQNIVMKIFYM